MNIEPTGHAPATNGNETRKVRYTISAVFGPDDEDEFVRYDMQSAMRLVVVLNNYMMAEIIKMRSEPC